MQSDRTPQRPDRVRPGGASAAAASQAVRARRTVAIAALALAVSSSVLGAARGDGPPSRPSASHPAAATTSAPTSPAPTGATTTGSTSGAATPSSAGAPAASAGPSGGPMLSDSQHTAAPTATATAFVPTSGNGQLTPVLVPGADSAASGRAVTYGVEVEGGLNADPAEVARTIGEILRDGRGWETQDKVHFVRVTPQQRAKGTVPKVIISLVSADTTDKMCAPLQTDGTWSCANKGHAVLNYSRWAKATPTYGSNLATYRIYQVNHEVGHALGHPHATCPGAGKPAPVMLQQSMGLGGCVTNAYPTVTHG